MSEIRERPHHVPSSSTRTAGETTSVPSSETSTVDGTATQGQTSVPMESSNIPAIAGVIVAVLIVVIIIIITVVVIVLWR